MTQPSVMAKSAMLARLALAAELPPRPRRAAVGERHRGDERVEQAGVVAPAVQRAQALEERVRVAAAQVVGAPGGEALELARHRRADVGNRDEVARHADIITARLRRVLSKT